MSHDQSDKDALLEIHLREYDKCKVEQMARISFRDNLVYVTLAAYGGIVSFAAKDNYLAWLILPWVSLILGWGYLVNDDKVSALGRYVRIELTDKIARLIGAGANAVDLFGWEVAHRSDARRRRRKIEQLGIDLICFIVPGLVSLVAFWVADPAEHQYLKGVAIVEGILLAWLAVEIWAYADLKSGR